MKQKNLLNLSMMLAAGLSANAQTQVFHEGFDAAQTKGADEKAYYEYINQITNDNGSDEFGVTDEDPAVGAGSLSMMNVSPGNDSDGNSDLSQHNNWWMRAVKFRNLPLEEGKSYRLSWRFKGSNTWNDGSADQKCKMSVALMQGGENCDIPLLDANGNEFRYEVSYFNPENYEKYTKMFYFASNKLQKDTYAEKNPDKAPLEDKYFATFNVYNPGMFYLDEVDLVESGIAGIGYEGSVIRVDFGYGTNVKDLVAASRTSGTLLMPEGTATVKINGEEVPIVSVELRDDGYMYIFISDDYAIEGEDAKLEVAFHNPADEQHQVQYKGDLAPEGAVQDFVDETASYLSGVGENVSFEYRDPALVSTLPADGSFNLAEGGNEVSFTFDRKVLTTDPNGTPLVAKLNDDEELEIVTEASDEGSETLTFRRKDGKVFTKGSYKVSVSDVTSAVGIQAFDTDFTTTFEVGKVQVAETVYTKLGSCIFPDVAAGTIPEGWTIYSDGEERPGGTSYGSGGRTFDTKAAQTSKGIYTRANGGEGSVKTAEVELPAGDVEIRSLLAYWSNASNIQVDILNSADEVVATEKFSPSVAGEKDRNTDGFKFDECAIRFNSTGGNYHAKYTLLTEGYNGMFVGGFDFYSVTETEGEKAETEIIAKGDFASTQSQYAPAHGTGWKIYRDNGNMRDPGANCGWGGDDWTGGGGPRVYTLGNKGMNGGAIYLAGNAYATYGEYLLETDHGGTIADAKEEKTLDLKASKYQFTYYIINWKKPGTPINMKLEIFRQEEGITGTPVYTRTDAVSESCESSNNSSPEAQKVNFFWNAPAAGKYILKFTAADECCIGNVSVETTSSLAVTYATMMNKNLDTAREELAAAKADDKYQGDTRNELEQTINDYTNPDFHTVDEYTAAFANLDRLVKKSSKRRANIDKYPSCLEGVKAGLEAAAGTKYEKLPQFPIVEKAYNDYKDVDYIAMSDEDLQEAVNTMGDNGTLISNMVEKCVPILTQQITDLAAAIVNLNADMTDGENETLLAAADAITDDQQLVEQLKKVYAAKLYKKIADGYDFKEFDEISESEQQVTIPASFLIQNPQFYTTAIVPTGKENVVATTSDFPGWTIEVLQGNINPIFTTAWGGTAGKDWTTPTCPIANCAVKTGWGTHEYDVQQLINNIPVANYDLSIKIGEDGTGDHGAYAYVGEGDAQQVQQYEGATDETGKVTYSRDNNQEANNKVFTGIAPTVDGNLGAILLGAHMKVSSGFGNIDDATITMTGKVAGFDYAAAAAALEKDIATGISNAEAAAPEGEPVAVVYYDLNGAMTTTPSGITIKVATYANGFVKVSKVLIK